MYRKTWMQVNLDKIEHNLIQLKEICQKKIIAVLKADAYGCGDIHVARAVLEAGAEMIAVSSLDEALVLRNEGYEGKLLILGATEANDIPVLIKYGISCTAYSTEWVHDAAKQNCKGLHVHLKVDTGMSRIGFRTIDELHFSFEKLQAASCDMEGIFTHFCCADSDLDLTNRQFSKFKEAVESFSYTFPWVHCDNSDATAFFKEDTSNACRIGISLYGISTYEKSLEPAISLFSEVVMVKRMHAGNTVGYGATYTAKDDEIIATLPIGYADGFIRANQGRKVYVEGQYAEIVGRVCMDQVMIHLDKEVPVNTVVEIFGEHISLEKMAEELNTIPYEIICLLSSRVTRRYIWHNKIQDEENSRLEKSILTKERN